tara:strand:- start:7187 stop:7594 length:408 start_codon:yes stop_codon:yes gene_type:complete
MYVVVGKERRVAVAVVFALPFILVRLVYSACAVFLHSHHFNIVTGNIVVLAIMAIAQEFIVVAIYVLLGFVVDKMDGENQGPIAGRAWKRKSNNKLSRRVERRFASNEVEAQRSAADANQEGVSNFPAQYHTARH